MMINPLIDASRYTDRVLLILRLAWEEAAAMGDRHMGTEHLLLGILREGRGVASNVLKNFAELSEIRREVFYMLGKDDPKEANHAEAGR